MSLPNYPGERNNEIAEPSVGLSSEINIDLMDTQEELDQELENIEASISEDLESSTRMTHDFVDKVEAIYEKTHTKMSPQLKMQAQHLVDEYSSLLAEANTAMETQQNIVERRGKDTGRSKRLAKKQADLQKQANFAKSQITSFVQVLTEVGDEPAPEKIEKTAPVIKTEMVKVETKTPEAKKEEVLKIKKMEPAAVVHAVDADKDAPKLSDGLLRLQQEGIAYLTENNETLAEMGVTTFDATPEGDTKKGGLQGIAELQNFLNENEAEIDVDGVRGTNTKNAVRQYKITQESAEVVEDVAPNGGRLLARAMMEALPGTGKTFAKDSVEGVRKEGEKYIGKYVIENGQKTDSLWYYPETEQWGVMTPDNKLTRDLSREAAVTMLKENISKPTPDNTENTEAAAEKMKGVKSEAEIVDGENFSFDKKFITSVEKRDGSGVYAEDVLCPLYNVVDINNKKTFVYVSPDGEIMKAGHYYQNFEMKDGVLTASPDKKYELIFKGELGLDKEDWNDIKNMDKGEWRRILEHRSEHADLSNFRYGMETPRDTLGKIAKIGPIDLGKMLDWMNGDRGKEFLESADNTLDGFAKNDSGIA